jgi:cyanophycinase
MNLDMTWRIPMTARPIDSLQRRILHWVVASCWWALIPVGQVHAERLANGRLVIVGGGLRGDHEAVYQAFLSGIRAEETVGVVPLASGVPESSGPAAVAGIERYAKQLTNVRETGLTIKNPKDASSAACAKTLRDCRALWFTGGDQNRIVATLRPDSGDTISYAAVRHVLETGGTVGGSSAGAAMMSVSMIRGGTSVDAMLLGASEADGGAGVRVGPIRFR